MTTKRALILQAYRELGFTSYDFDLEPEQLQDALASLDGMMSTWSMRGLNLGYFPNTADINADAGTDPAADQAIALNLAMRLAPGKGKTPSRELKVDARSAYSALVKLATLPAKTRLNTHAAPAGQGANRWYHDPFLEETEAETPPDLTSIPRG